MQDPINAAYFFRFACPDCGLEIMPEELAVSFLNLNLDGASVQAAYAGRELPPELSKLFLEPVACELHGKVSRLLRQDEVFLVGPPRSDRSAAQSA
jgi:hypothetical protein